MQDQNTAVEVRVPGSSLPLYTDGKSLAAMKPIAEYFGLDWKTQHRKLEGKSWACMVKMTMQLPGDTQRREVVGVEPGKYPLTLSNGQTRDVLAYTEADRDLLEQVWRDYYSPMTLEVHG